MTLSQLFHPESPPEALDENLYYVVFSTLQWRTPNLDVMTRAGKQRFAVLYNQPLDERFMMETLEQAHIHGAMSGVKVVAVHKNLLCLFLSDEVSSTTFHAIESLWEPIKDLDLNQRLEIDFFCEHEAYSDRSDYCFWPVVKEILELNTLGIEQYRVPVIHDCAEEIFSGDEPVTHQFHVDIRQSFTSQPAAPTQLSSIALESIASKIGHSNHQMSEYYVSPLPKSPGA